MSKRFGFVTCVRLGKEVLDEIREVGGRVDAILTLPDDAATGKSGRVFLDDVADAHGAELKKSGDINEPSTVDWLRRQHLDWLLIIGWSQIAQLPVLQAARSGTLGMHPTLLPQGRGRASIPWAILKGLSKTGVTFFKLDEGVDTGPILDQEVVPVAPDENATSLYERVVTAHRALIRRNWDALAHGNPAFVPQDEASATYWPARKPEDGRIDPRMSLSEVDRLVRAVAPPYPGAWWTEGEEKLRVIEGQVGTQSEGIRIRLHDGIYTATKYEAIE